MEFPLSTRRAFSVAPNRSQDVLYMNGLLAVNNVIQVGNDATYFVFLEHLIGLGFQILPKLLWAAATLVLTRWIAKFGRRLSRQLLDRIEPTLQRFLTQAISIVIWIIGSVAALSAMGIETTSLIAVIGAAGLAVGLALQNSLSHFAAGILLISLRPFEVGDSIDGGGVSGTVESIGLFSTTIVTADHVRITVPNGSLFSGILRNQSALGTRRVDIKLNIADRPIQPTIDQLLEIVQSHPFVLLNPPPTCVVIHLRPAQTLISLRPWCPSGEYDQVRSDLLLKIQAIL
jgi:small conductance mechanosensitive channel